MKHVLLKKNLFKKTKKKEIDSYTGRTTVGRGSTWLDQYIIDALHTQPLAKFWICQFHNQRSEFNPCFDSYQEWSVYVTCILYKGDMAWCNSIWTYSQHKLPNQVSASKIDYNVHVTLCNAHVNNKDWLHLRLYNCMP